ncbi:type I restriction-modification system endonuclease [Oceanospirillum sanctuarii]|uniref:type I restriction-modification system endonuclease n=1 Tax=Oceanospirillum sanctuarii TaxID=1434821 RepID=UPI000A37E364|nr:type I restriction-modification system endonuclease [Oceanospirillum sanctuarii]
MSISANFGFLQQHDPLFLELAEAAERVFVSDPNTTLIKLRQLGEAMAQHLALLADISFDEKTTQIDLLNKVSRELQLDPAVREMFHILRIEGNKATHQFKTQHKEAIRGLVVARNLAIWFHESSGKAAKNFKAGPFTPPKDPSEQLNNLQQDIAQLKNELQQANLDLNSSQKLNELIAKEKEEYESLALAMDEESRQLAEQAKAHEQALEQQQKAYEQRIQALQEQLAQQDEKSRQAQRQTLTRNSRAASQNIQRDNEALARILIDQQLQRAGWLAASDQMKHSKGTRPEKGVNKAIAEWPCKGTDGKGRDRADYVLFAGLTPMGVVEAKKETLDVAGKIDQAERYSRGFRPEDGMIPAWELAGRTIAWPDETSSHYQIPFVYSANGRPYLPQMKEKSGIWFRDVRDGSHIKRALPEFHSPAGLTDRLNRSREAAQTKLQAEPYGYLKLRDYQQKAIGAVENALSRDVRRALLAMATGTGKTRTIIGLIYRFLKAERFKRILFLVDRTSLGTQALDAFKDMPLERSQTLSQIYNVAELGDMAAQAETRVQVATVQAMVKRVLESDNPPPIDQFDCIIVDEAHRGYTLDQEMTEGELSTRDARQYLSSYRRVLDYFDAVKIALTATPAKHTSDIFGHPIYSYGYREAVADDWLIDHEPPIRYTTLLSENGITFEQGDQVEVVNSHTGEIESAELEDELNFDVSAFNKSVITPSFNKVICEQLVQELDPFGEEKTLIFCATDSHADMVKSLLDEAFSEEYEGDYRQEAVAKITGKSDQVAKLISRFKNERYPNIAITVDLLTTGIDVPRICNLVFMRRVKSRILYEQMKGRATRRCDEIGKTLFRIYDPVDLYASLQEVDTMKPLVKNPNITLEQLVEELTDPEQLERALNSPGDLPEQSQADVVLSQLSQKVMRVLRKAQSKAEHKPEIKAKLDQLQQLWQVEPAQLHQHLHQLGPKQAAEFLSQHSGLINQLDEVKQILGSSYRPIISNHDDEIKEREQSWGDYKAPEDYLDSFNRFIKEQINQNAALSAVVNRPRDLTREQLREIKLQLDNAGFSEARLQSAEAQLSNQEIAASIIGHIRRAALGEGLVPFEQRVNSAMQRIYDNHNWNPNQKRWLGRLAKQLAHEVIVDQEFINREFAQDGGAKRFNKVLNDQLDQVLEELNDGIWAEQSA